MSSFFLLFAREEDLKEITVVVTDKRGNFIEGLRKYDFEIYENKKMRNIVDFYLREVIDGRLTIKHENGEAEWKPREFLIIFDQTSADYFSLQNIKIPINNFLKKYFTREDNIYFFMGRFLIAWQGGRLLRFGQKEFPLGESDSSYKMISEMIEEALSTGRYLEIPETRIKEWHPREKPEEYLSDFEINYKKFAAFNLLDRLKAVALAAEKIKGEKIALLISKSPQQVGYSPIMSEKKGPTSYITGGFFRGKVIDDRKSVLPSVSRPSSLGELFSHSNTTIYSVILEPRRLETPQLESTDIFKNTFWEKESADSSGAQDFPKDYLSSVKNSYQDLMRSLSKETGGIAITRVKNIEESLRQIGRDINKSYLLSYSSATNGMDGKFRKIKVKVKRKGIKVRYRKGYYAIDEEREELKQLVESLEKKTSSNKLITFIRSRAIPLENNKYYLLIKIEPKGLILNDIVVAESEIIKGSLIGQVRIYFRLENEEGKARDMLDKRFDFKVNESELDIRPAIYFGQELEKGKYRVRIALKDKIGEEVTTHEKIIEIEDTEGKRKKRGGLDNLFFVKEIALIKELNEIKELFVYKDEKIYPRLDNEFKPDENLSLYFEMNSKDEEGIDLYFQIMRNEQLFKTYKMSSPLKTEINPFLINIPLNDFPFGEYILQITAIERGKRKHYIARKDFKVVL